VNPKFVDDSVMLDADNPESGPGYVWSGTKGGA